jgi:hypothetical protein
MGAFLSSKLPGIFRGLGRALPLDWEYSLKRFMRGSKAGACRSKQKLSSPALPPPVDRFERTSDADFFAGRAKKKSAARNQ